MINSNQQLTAHFTLRELVEGILPQQAIELNWHQLTPEIVQNLRGIAQELEKIREWARFNIGKDVKVKIMSGFRCVEWEHIRKRSGNSQHTIGAADFQFTGIPEKEIIQLHSDLYLKYNAMWEGGVAIKNPTYENGKIKTIGFVHIDNGKRRRWTYI